MGLLGEAEKPAERAARRLNYLFRSEFLSAMQRG
nr:MAG TPA: hypothetical protein [Caudoviricetes sp.]